MTVAEVTQERVVPLTGLGVGDGTQRVLAAAERLGFAAGATAPGVFRLARTYRPRWASVVTIILAPVAGLGLLFLLVKRHETLVVTVFEDRVGTRVRIVGADTERLAAAIAADGSSGPGAASSDAQRAGSRSTPAGGTSFARAESAPAPILPGSMSPVASTAAPPAGLIDMWSAHSATIAAAKHDDEARTIARGALPDLDRTIARSLLPLPGGAGGVDLVLADGSRIPVGAGVVIGRNPQPTLELPAARMVRIDDRSLSKTHASIGANGSGVWILDHHSTNGTAVRRGADFVAATAGVRVDVPAGAAVRFGDVTAEVAPT